MQYINDFIAKLKIGERLANLGGWIGLILIHGSTIPTLYSVMKSEAVMLPPLNMVLLIWTGLFLFFIRSAIIRDNLYLISNGIGFFLQTIMLAVIVYQ